MKKKIPHCSAQEHSQHTDTTITLNILKNKAHTVFDIERDWNQFHSLKNLSMNIATEAAELMEHFLWVSTQESDALMHDEKKAADIRHELADVLIGVIQFAHKANIDLSQAFFEKIALIEKKYPIEKAKGSSKKYTDL